jgi:asparagine synthase (glutamine-hydrolysing)
VGALYGILGGTNHAELRALGDRLAHRGREAAEWSPGRDIHLGIRGPRRIVDVQEHGPVAFEGAIDNRNEIARLLRRRDGDAVGPAHDGFLAFELVESIGPEGLDRLAGQFAIACWHGPDRRLLLARDRIGCAPLYFTIAGDRLAFASEYKALLALDGVVPRPDLEALQIVLGTGWARPGHTCVQGIFPVAPGSCLEARPGRISSRRYCEIEPAGSRDTDHPSQLGDSLLGALERQAAGYGRIGLGLNGGPQSAPLAQAVRAVAWGREIHTISAGCGADDRALLEAARVAREIGARHHSVLLQSEDLETLLPWLVWHLEQPAGDEEIAYLFAAAREAARQVAMIVSDFGLGGFLPGQGGHRLTELARSHPVLRRLLSPVSLAGRALKTAYYRRRDFPAPRVRGARPLPSSTGSANLSLKVPPPQGAIERLYSGAGLRLATPCTDPAFLRTALANPGLPFVPPRGGGNRLAQQLRMSDALDRLAVELLSPATVRDRGFFEPAYVTSLLQRTRGRPYGEERSRRIWSLLLTELWARAFLDHGGAAPEHPLPPLRPLGDIAAPATPASGAVR